MISEEVVETPDMYSEYVLEPDRKDFEAIIGDGSKNVFVHFYEGNCDECERLTPHWNKLGKHFKDDPDVLIAKLDAGDLGFETLPSIIAYTKTNKDGEPYMGELEYGALKSYVEYENFKQDADDGEEDDGEEEEEGDEDHKDEL